MKQVVKPHLVYRLVPMRKSVVFQVLEMDDNQRVRYAEFEASNGITVCSIDGPYIDNRTRYVWLRGRDDTRDDDLARCTYFKSNEARDAFIANVHQALREWHEAGGFEQARRFVGEAHPIVVTDGFTYRLGGEQ